MATDGTDTVCTNCGQVVCICPDPISAQPPPPRMDERIDTIVTFTKTTNDRLDAIEAKVNAMLRRLDIDIEGF